MKKLAVFESMKDQCPSKSTSALLYQLDTKTVLTLCYLSISALNTIHQGNVWDVGTIEDFQQYCCTECDFKAKEGWHFQNHLVQQHLPFPPPEMADFLPKEPKTFKTPKTPKSKKSNISKVRKFIQPFVLHLPGLGLIAFSLYL